MRTASANGTGSPGACHAVTVSGARTRYSAGSIRSAVNRRSRSSVCRPGVVHVASGQLVAEDGGLGLGDPGRRAGDVPAMAAMMEHVDRRRPPR